MYFKIRRQGLITAKALAGAFLGCLLLGSHVLATESAPSFSGDRAMELLEAQCALGTRAPGTVGNARLRTMLVDEATRLGLKPVVLCFRDQDPFSEGKKDMEICNLVISTGPTEGQRLWLGAHYDTRPVCDRDPDPARRGEFLPGANDGASGVAVLWHLMELLSAQPPPQGVDFLFFDGEDSGRSQLPRSYCLGSQHLVATRFDMGNPLGIQPRGLVLLDMVGEKELRIPMERNSYMAAPEWTMAIFARAAELGLDAFVPEVGTAVFDDHIPFLEAGIPAVDLIDFTFPQWHTTGDTPEVCSPGSLEQVGILLVDLVYNP